MPAVTYAYAVAGADYTSDKYSYAFRGLKQELARQEVDAIPDQVDVYYDPAKPSEAYLNKHTPTIGRWLIAGGIVGILIGLVVLAS